MTFLVPILIGGLLLYGLLGVTRGQEAPSPGLVVASLGGVVAFLVTLVLLHSPRESEARSCHVYLIASAIVIAAGVLADAIRKRS
jgi:hypothetical protein